MDNNKETTLDDLARMVQGGFSDLENRLTKRMDSMEIKIDSMNTKISALQEGQERIELRLSNFAYRFEVLDLQKRVEILEEKLGVKQN